MRLAEVFDTKPTVTWQRSADASVATFELAGASYEVSLSNFEVPEGKLVYLVFKKDGSVNAVQGEAPAAKVLGAVMNTALPELKRLGADVLLLAVRKDSGAVDSRKRIYSAFATLLTSGGSFSFSTGWEENALAFYKLISKDDLTPSQLDFYSDKAKEIEELK